MFDSSMCAHHQWPTSAPCPYCRAEAAESKLDTALGLLNVAYAAMSDGETRVARGFARDKIRAFARQHEREQTK